MQPLTKIIDVDGYAHIKRDTDVIATFQNQDDANLFLQAESMVSAADLSIQAGLSLLKEREELIAERDALAAHVERWKDWLSQDVEDDDCEWVDEGWNIHRESPENSLARRDKRVAADALESLGMEWRSMEMDQDRVDCIEYVEQKADRLRRKAEGDAS